MDARVAEFNKGGMEKRGDVMWCRICQIPINHTDRTTTMKHLLSQKHTKAKTAESTIAKKPGGSSAAMLSKPTIQSDLKIFWDGKLTGDKVAEDFTAAFLQAGISVHKLDHPSMRGLIQIFQIQSCQQQDWSSV